MRKTRLAAIGGVLALAAACDAQLATRLPAAASLPTATATPPSSNSGDSTRPRPGPWIYEPLVLATAAPVALQSATVENLEVDYQRAANPVGVIYFFHGMGGSASRFAGATESRVFDGYALAAGYSVVYLDSADRLDSMWTFAEPPAPDPDLDQLRRVRTYLVTFAGFPAGLPEYGVGMSVGGAFVTLAGYDAGLAAVAVHGSPGWAKVLSRGDYQVPTLFVMNRNDPSANNPQMQANHDLLAAAGVRTDLIVHEPGKLAPERFLRISDVATADAAEIFSSVASAGIVAPDGTFVASPATLKPSALGAYISQFAQIKEELSAVYADHRFVADHVALTLGFFAASKRKR